MLDILNILPHLILKITCDLSVTVPVLFTAAKKLA